MPDVYGQQYEAIPADRVFAYSESNPPPNCDDGGQTQAPYEEVAGNAFYCSNGDFVAYDEQGLLPKLRENFGEFAVGLVFAHELGHAVQARVDYNPSATVYLEQQADCFAGAWAQHVASSEDENVHLSTDDLDNALAGLLTLSDPSGIDGGQDGAHGNGFDRVGAFQDGYEGGAETCAAYESTPPDVTESGYTSYADQASDGNLALDELVPTITKSLDDYWTSQSSKLTAPTVAAERRRLPAPTVTATVACSPTRSPTSRRQHACATTRRRCRTCTTTSATSAAACSWPTAWASSVQHQLGMSSRHRRGASRRRVPGRCVGGEPVVVVVARRPRRGGDRAGRRGSRDNTDRGYRLRPGGGVPCRVQARSVEVRAVELTPSPQLERGSGGVCNDAHAPGVLPLLTQCTFLSPNSYDAHRHSCDAGAFRRSGPSTEGGAATRWRPDGCSSPRTTRACATRWCAR